MGQRHKGRATSFEEAYLASFLAAEEATQILAQVERSGPVLFVANHAKL